MQLTGPAFLFLFLPLSVLPTVFLPQRWRSLTLSLLSLCWYVPAHFYNPFGLLHVFLTVLFSFLLYLPGKRNAAPGKVRTALGITLPLLSFIAARLLEHLSPSYVYPVGLGFIALSAISLAIDRARGTQKARSPFDLLAFLLFFPTLSAGPAVRYRHFMRMLEKSTPSPGLFAEGVRFYTMGYIKRLALAAVLTRTLGKLLSGTATNPLFFLSALFLSFLFLYFFVTGTADMARGISAMYGLWLPGDRTNILFTAAPHTMFFSIFHSLYRYLLDYIGMPLRHALPGKWGKILAGVLIWLCFFLFFGLHPAFLLLALPVLLSLLVAWLAPKKKPLPLPLRILSSILSLLFSCLISLALLSGDPRGFWELSLSLFKNPFVSYYNFFLSVPDAQYLLWASLVISGIVCLQILGHYRKWSPRMSRLLRGSAMPLLLVGFLLTLIFFMPQFPQYANTLFGGIT